MTFEKERRQSMSVSLPVDDISTIEQVVSVPQSAEGIAERPVFQELAKVAVQRNALVEEALETLRKPTTKVESFFGDLMKQHGACKDEPKEIFSPSKEEA